MAEGWLPSVVNNNIRAGWSIFGGLYDDLSGQNTVGGTANAITITSNIPLGALAEGVLVAFQNSSGPNTAAVTVNVDGLGAKAIRLPGDVALVGGELLDDGIYFLRYDASANAWIVLNGRQLAGTTTNDSAGAGQVGEIISSEIVSGSAVALTTNIPADVTSISLTAGDWDVWGTVALVNVGTTVTAVQGAINTTSANLGTVPNAGTRFAWNGSSAAGTPLVQAVGMRRVSISGTTTVYLVAQGTFTGGTSLSGYGYLGARRRR